MAEQFDLFDWVLDLDIKKKPEERMEPQPAIANWSYGVVQLENGDLFLAEIYWDEDENPVAYCEPHLVADPDDGIDDLIKSLQNAIFDLTENPAAIPVSVFHTSEDND